MSYRLSTILWAFALTAAALATFGAGGIVAAVGIVALWANAQSKRRRALFDCLLMSAIVGVIVGLVLPWLVLGDARESGRRTQCANQLMQLAKALQMYVANHGALPQAAQPGRDNAGPISWRVAILPMLDERTLFERYRRDEAWHTTANMVVSRTPLSIMLCPSDVLANSFLPPTSYFAVVDPRTAWPPDHGRPLREITDGTRNTILLIEMMGRNSPWAKPADLTFDEALTLLTNPPAGATVHRHWERRGFFYKADDRHGVNVAFADGSVRFVALPLSPSLATALLTADAGDAVDLAELDRATEPQFDYARCYSLAVFVLLALLPAYRLFSRPTAPEPHFQGPAAAA